MDIIICPLIATVSISLHCSDTSNEMTCTWCIPCHINVHTLLRHVPQCTMVYAMHRLPWIWCTNAQMCMAWHRSRWFINKIPSVGSFKVCCWWSKVVTIPHQSRSYIKFFVIVKIIKNKDIVLWKEFEKNKKTFDRYNIVFENLYHIIDYVFYIIFVLITIKQLHREM